MHEPQQSLAELQRALAGRYELEGRLGRGGMGVVFLAREVRLDRRVAIKLLPPAKAANPVARERFLREARMAAQLSHPNIVPIFSVGEVGDVVYYAMAYIPGETLGQRVRERGALPVDQGARVVRQVAWALGYAHERGVVHRDVKPDNILLDAATGGALIADFGIARLVSQDGDTGPREVVGTAEFMSPEQASGQPVDPRSDLYSLGVVGYYALAGCLPFDAPDGYAMLARHVADPAPPLGSVAAAVPRRLGEVIDRCLAKNPAARFQSGAELAQAIARAAAEPVDPPLAIRAFLVGSRHLSPAALVYGVLAGLAVPLLLIDLVLSPDASRRWVLGGLAAAILFPPLGLMLSRVRRLRIAGFDLPDLAEAIESELARRREELAFLYGQGPSRLEQVLRGFTYAALAAAAAGVYLLAPGTVPLAAIGVTAGLALCAALGARARTEHRTDPKRERRLRFWRGPIGRWLFRVAGMGLPKRDDRRRQRGAAEPAVGVVGDRFFEMRELEGEAVGGGTGR